MEQPLPEISLRLPASSTVRFVGDLHLGDRGRNDAFRDKDELFIDFLKESERACDALVFMGDAFDVPQAWSLKSIVRAHPKVMQAIESMARRVPTYFVRGNHDWKLNYQQLFPHAHLCEALAVGDTLVWHGHRLDRFCHPDRAFHRWAIAIHHALERAFGFEFRVPLWEHDTWQNRVGHWLGWQYALHLRRTAPLWRALGWGARAEEGEEFIRYWSRAVWGDANALFPKASKLIRQGPYQAMVCGHTHLAGQVALGEDRYYVNAGSWAFAKAEFATWENGSFKVEDRSTQQALGDEAYRWMLAGADPGDFFVWWAAHYRGWLRFESKGSLGIK